MFEVVFFMSTSIFRDYFHIIAPRARDRQLARVSLNRRALLEITRCMVKTAMKSNNAHTLYFVMKFFKALEGNYRYVLAFELAEIDGAYSFFVKKFIDRCTRIIEVYSGSEIGRKWSSVLDEKDCLVFHLISRISDHMRGYPTIGDQYAEYNIRPLAFELLKLKFSDSKDICSWFDFSYQINNTLISIISNIFESFHYRNQNHEEMLKKEKNKLRELNVGDFVKEYPKNLVQYTYHFRHHATLIYNTLK